MIRENELSQLQQALRGIVDETHPLHPDNYEGEYQDDDVRMMYDLFQPVDDVVYDETILDSIGLEFGYSDPEKQTELDEMNRRVWEEAARRNGQANSDDQS